MSSAFASAVATPQSMPPDPAKRVNYTLGMLLGVDDFNQEHAYLAGRNRWLTRDGLGSGTINGLAVSVDTGLKGPRVVVSAGAAASASGCLICVKTAQCAFVNDWLSANQAEVSAALHSPPGDLRLSLVLTYRSCPMDSVPIPGEPCRSEQDLMAPSRLVDDFALELRLTASVQPEEDGIRQFATWLDQIQITDTPGTFTTLDQFIANLRSAIPTADFVKDHGLVFALGSPLSGARVHKADSREFFRAAMRIWVTEIRPLVHAGCLPSGCCCGCGSTGLPADADDSVLLAELLVPVILPGVGQQWKVDSTKDVRIDETRRPIVVHARLMQELWASSTVFWK